MCQLLINLAVIEYTWNLDY